MKFTEEQKQKICDYIQQSLNSAKLKYFGIEGEEEFDGLPLVDHLSVGSTIKEGQEEIENIVEQIYFDMNEWDV